MIVSVYITECVCICLVFGVLVFGVQMLNPLAFVSDYPPQIQQVYYESQHKQETKKSITKRTIAKKVCALIILLFLFAWMAHKAGAQTFVQGIGFGYGYMIVLIAFDTFFLDWVLFANVKRIRLPGTEHMDKEYRQKAFHVKAVLPMLPLFALCGLAVSGLMLLLF